jgi:hypothetical protein
MAQKAVMDAVAARLGNPWISGVDSASLPVFDPNTTGQSPVDGSPFIEIQYPISNADQISIGSPGSQVFRDLGAIRFVLSIQRGSGVSQGMGWCDEIAALFRGKQFSGVNTWAPSSPVLDNSNDNGNYWIMSFAVPYYFDIIG